MIAFCKTQIVLKRQISHLSLAGYFSTIPSISPDNSLTVIDIGSNNMINLLRRVFRIEMQAVGEVDDVSV